MRTVMAAAALTSLLQGQPVAGSPVQAPTPLTPATALSANQPPAPGLAQPPLPGDTLPKSTPPPTGAGNLDSSPPSPVAEVVPGQAKPDTCQASALAEFVGKPRAELPVATDLSRRQVVCTGCPMEPDVRPERQTITYDPKTGRVTKVACG